MKLVSLNVEGSKHWPLIGPFLDAERPDVLCLQEVFEDDAAREAGRLGMEHAFSPMTYAPRTYTSGDMTGPIGTLGIALLSRIPPAASFERVYRMTADPMPRYDVSTLELRHATIRQTLLAADIPYEGGKIRIATTHFTWTPDGMPDRYQEEDARALMAILNELSPDVFCGDLNVPRNVNPLYKIFASAYRDAIPESYATSLDFTMHKAIHDVERLEQVKHYMVDHLFLAGGWQARNVRLQPGVSDHCAIVAELSQNEGRL